MESETPAAEDAVMELGRTIATLIPQTGPLPDILKRLPLDGLEEKTIRYLHHPMVLNYHFYIADDNILNISSDTEAALATYHLDNEKLLLLLVEYPDAQMARSAIESFFGLYLPDADQTGSARLEDGKWSVAEQKGSILAVVLEAETKEAAHQLLAAIREHR